MTVLSAKSLKDKCNVYRCISVAFSVFLMTRQMTVCLQAGGSDHGNTGRRGEGSHHEPTNRQVLRCKLVHGSTGPSIITPLPQHGAWTGLQELLRLPPPDRPGRGLHGLDPRSPPYCWDLPTG
jgi:hypothetical protein